MHLSFYLRRVGYAVGEVTEQSMFDAPQGKSGKVLLVENEEEEEIMEAMQLMYGSQLNIQIKDAALTVDSYTQIFSRVYTTWDPRDRNRI